MSGPVNPHVTVHQDGLRLSLTPLPGAGGPCAHCGARMANHAGLALECYQRETCYEPAPAGTRLVVIPATNEHGGYDAMHVLLPWTCLVCGGPRGEPTPGFSYDGSRRLAVDTWKNPCGHVEKYGMIRDSLRKGGA